MIRQPLELKELLLELSKVLAIRSILANAIIERIGDMYEY